MYLIRSYEDFLDYMRFSGKNASCIIPVVLIRPGTVMRMNERNGMDDFFDYFDARTGDITFFLPGYSYTPGTKLSHLFDKIVSGQRRRPAFSIQRLGEVEASNQDFVSFINTLENRCPSYRYYGNTELLLFRYIPGSGYERGEFDFRGLRRYNLTEVYRRRGRPGLMRFLETLLHDYRDFSEDFSFSEAADLLYNDIVQETNYGE